MDNTVYKAIATQYPSRTILVRSVSKRSFLVQHGKLVQRISVGLEGVGIKFADVACRALDQSVANGK